MNKYKVRSSSGNVFADLRVINFDDLLIKAEFVQQIAHSITTKNLTQTETVRLLGSNNEK
jgi:predicted XRE-type DNA-binding protein